MREVIQAFTVVDLMPRCATCKHWKQGDPFDEPFMPEEGAWGTCDKLSEETGVHIMEYFYTIPTFGCVEHEAKA